MKKARFTETQIVNILKLADSGMKVEDICRQNGISNATYYNWKSKYGGMEANDVKRLKELEDENAKLKKLFAEVSLENHAMKELFRKKGLVVAEKRSCAQSLKEAGLSVIKACKLTSLSRATFYHQQIDWRKKDQVVIDAIQSVLAKSPQSGFWKCYFRLRFQGYPFNHKRVYRVYCRLGLNQKRRVKKVLPKREKRPLVIEKVPNIQWALDFMHDSLYCGKRFRTLNIIDEGTRECLAIEVDTSLPAERVIRVLERLKAERGLPKQIRVDNGPELISVNLLNYCEDNQILLCHIQPGKPQQNGFIERFNGSFRREFLNAYLFESLSQVRELAWFWLQDYNQNRTHESLNHLPPEAYRQQLENSNLTCLN
ncbi:IS3 family transposase [Moellerella wisconsensis]|nr:IS3 family transposase [Moellerella wisconsensis]UNH25633.1 IS3 family transposase [Moellerella wisconsensis]UNH25680.1 IS3 family transposase [Moellerella wisconsensis]UNH25684.1 IS3 family transposase [Moellerella wisconsensis]